MPIQARQMPKASAQSPRDQVSTTGASASNTPKTIDTTPAGRATSVRDPCSDRGGAERETAGYERPGGQQHHENNGCQAGHKERDDADSDVENALNDEQSPTFTLASCPHRSAPAGRADQRVNTSRSSVRL